MVDILKQYRKRRIALRFRSGRQEAPKLVLHAGDDLKDDGLVIVERASLEIRRRDGEVLIV
jgi:type III secretion system FlhB-like substrate exporter